MGSDPSQGQPKYRQVRAGGEYAVQPFEDADEADYAAINPLADIESNELTLGTGKVCHHCGAVIASGSETRRLVSGEFQHEICPPPPPPPPKD